MVRNDVARWMSWACGGECDPAASAVVVQETQLVTVPPRILRTLEGLLRRTGSGPSVVLWVWPPVAPAAQGAVGGEHGHELLVVAAPLARRWVIR